MARKKIDVLKYKEGLSIKIDWFTPAVYFLLPFTLFWNGIIFFFLEKLWFSPGVPFLMKFAPILHLLVGLGLIYTVASIFLNKTYVDVYDGMLNIHHDPIPHYRSKKSIELDSLDQLYVKEKIKKTKNGVKHTYELRAILSDREDIKLLNVIGLESQDLFRLEKELEEYIGMVDKPVSGEFGAKVYNIDTEKLDLLSNPSKEVVKETIAKRRNL